MEIFEKKEAERGHNITVRIHLMRHGEKAADGNLSKAGALKAQELGSNMGQVQNIKAYTSSVPRVIETAENVQLGVDSENQFERRNRDELSASLLRVPGAESSDFFTNIVLKRLVAAHHEPEVIREQKIKEAEQKNMMEWLSHGDELVDKTTNSPKNVARAVAHHLIRQIDMADRLKDGSNIDLLDVTHEFMLATIIKYAVEKKNEDGTIITGDEIMQRKQSIDYLESLDITVEIDEAGAKQINLTIGGEPYTLKLDSLRTLAGEYSD